MRRDTSSRPVRWGVSVRAVLVVLVLGLFSFMFTMRGWSGAVESWSSGSRSSGLLWHLYFRERLRQGNIFPRTWRADISMVRI